MLQSFSGPKRPNACGFCFTRGCWSCTSPGGLCSSWAVTHSPHAGAAAASSRPRRGGRTTAAFRAGRGAAGAGKVEVVSGRIPWCCRIQCALRQGPWCPRRDFEANAWSLWNGLWALVRPKRRQSFCATKTLKMPITSALTNPNNLLLLSLNLAKYFTPS